MCPETCLESMLSTRENYEKWVLAGEDYIGEEMSLKGILGPAIDSRLPSYYELNRLLHQEPDTMMCCPPAGLKTTGLTDHGL